MNNYKKSTEAPKKSWTKILKGMLLMIILAMPAGLMSQPQSSIVLGESHAFVILAGSGITSIPASSLTGDVGLSPTTGAAIMGLTSGEVTGTIYTVDTTGPSGSLEDFDRLVAAKSALTSAYNDAKGRTPEDVLNPGGGDIGGLVLSPGLYKFSSTAAITGNVTFDAGGNEHAVFIMQIGSTLTTAVGSKVILIGNAKERNIFWQVGSSATLGVNSIFKGTIMADQSITLNSGVQVVGRMLAINAAVSIDSGSITKPVSSSSIADDQTVPKEFSLQQNYPNPFNPSTVIQYSIAKDSQVSLKVFDMLGQEVASLVDEYQNAGKYSVQFDTENGISNLSAGVYFYRMKADSYVSVKKLMLIK